MPLDRPVIITGEVEHWPAYQRWQPRALAQAHGERLVGVTINTKGEWTPSSAQRASMDLAMFLALAESGEKVPYFVVQDEAIANWAFLLDDWEAPRVLTGERVHSCHFWVGPPSTLTHLHWDRYPGLLALTHGKKEVALYPPSAWRNLYPVSLGDGLAEPRLPMTPGNWSEVDVNAPDRERFPRFFEVEPWRGTVAGGEILLIPRFWWHAVWNRALSVGINFWWDPAADQAIDPHDLTFYRDRGLISRLSRMVGRRE